MGSLGPDRVPCPSCGQEMRRRGTTSSICDQCAQGGGSGPGWPSSNDGLLAEVVCPHCIALPHASCCVCETRRRILIERLGAVMRSVWARPGCSCDACARAGSMPTDDDAMLSLSPSPSSSASPFAKGFAQREAKRLGDVAVA